MYERDSYQTGPLIASNELSKLYRILARANQIASNTELDELLEQMLDLITAVCGSQIGTLYLLDQETNELVFKVVHGDEESQKLVGQRFSSNKGISGATLHKAQPIIVENLHNDPRWFGRHLGNAQNRLRNSISIPLLLRGTAIGVVQVFNYKQAPIEVVQLLGSRMTSEIEKAVLLQASKQRGRHLETLVGIIKEMSMTLDRDLLLNHIILAARKLLNAEASSLFLIDEDSGDLILKIASHLNEISLPLVRIPAGQGVIGHVVTSGETLLVNDASADKRHYAKVDKISGLETKSILAVPLQTPTVVLGQDRGTTEPKIIGGIEAINKLDGNFNQEDTAMLNALADQAATVLLFASLYNDANELFIDSIKAITAAIDAKDPYTRGHSQRVSDFSRIVAQEMALTPEIVHHVRVGGLLHDLGKIGVPDSILSKPDRLTAEEYDLMKKHTVIGANIMKEVRMLKRELPALAEHHERVDGKGYPNGLVKDEISLAGRIVAVADVFDALTSDRPYRKALSPNEALKILDDNRNTHLDSRVVDALIRAYLAGKIKTQWERHLEVAESIFYDNI